MSFIEMNGLDDVTEQQPIIENNSLESLTAAGTKKLTLQKDYTLVVKDVKEKNGDDGSLKGLLVIHEIEGCPDNANVMHNLTLPLPEDDADKRKAKLLFAKRYLTLFKIPFANGIDVTKMIGARAKAKLTLEEYDGTWSNKLVLPAIK